MRWASRRRARSVTARWTAGRSRARSQPRTSCSRSGAPCDAPAAASSSSRRSAPRGKTCWRPEQEMAWMRRLSEELDLPVSFTLLQIDAAPDAWRGLMDESLRALRRRRAGGAAGRGATLRHAARLPDPSRLQRSAHLPRARRPLVTRRAARRAGEAGGASADPGRARRRARPDGAVRRHVPAGAGLARPPLRARRPAGVRADPRPHDRGDGGGGRHRAHHDAVRRHARVRRATPAHAAVLQLRRAQPRRHPRDVAAPGGGVGTVRRRRALRAHL